MQGISLRLAKGMDPERAEDFRHLTGRRSGPHGGMPLGKDQLGVECESLGRDLGQQWLEVHGLAILVDEREDTGG